MKAIKIYLTLFLIMLVSLQAQNSNNKNEEVNKMKLFELPQLKYGFDALEPHIDKMTMEIHYGKHHGAYVTNLNNALKDNNISVNSIEELMENISKYPVAIRNNGGGHYNHTLFWEIIGPNAGGEPVGNLAKSIDETFGSFDKFKEEFTKAALGRFGSGWAWLIVADKKLLITSTPNQDNTLMDISEVKGFPILGLDVWEHAYYLKYQNRRADYINAFWNIVNWEEVEKRYNSIK